MRDVTNITVEKLIIHILNNSQSSGEPVLSNHECEITDDIAVFFADHIQRSLVEDKARIAKFRRPDGLVKVYCESIFNRPSKFIANSQKLAEAVFEPMKQMRQISSGDFAVCLYSADTGSGKGTFIGMLKMDFKSAYKHTIKGPANDRTIQLVPQKDLLPSPDQRVQKGVFIRPPEPSQYDMVILDNQIKTIYEAAGSANFFSKTFLDAELGLTDTDKTRLFKTRTSEWVEKNYPKLPADQAHNITRTASEAIRSDSVNVRTFADVVITDASLRQDYLVYLRQKGLEDTEFTPDRAFAEKLTKRKKYKADGELVLSGEAEDFDRLVTVDFEKDLQNRITVTIKTTRWTEMK
jgi:hypothetical protein